MRAAGLPGPRGGDARGRAAGPAGRHDLADRGPRALARPPWPTRSARRRRSRWRSSSSAACSCTLFLTRYLMPVLYSFFPAPAGHGAVRGGPDRGLALHRPVPPARPHAAGHRRRHHDHGDSRRPRSSTGHDGFRRASVMKINWKLLVAVVVIAAGATGLALNKLDPGPRRGRLEAVVSGRRPTARRPPGQDPGLEPPAKSKAPWDRTLTLEPTSRSRRSAWRRSPVKQQTEPTVLTLSGTTDYDPATRDGRPHPVRQPRRQGPGRSRRDGQEGRPAARAVQHRPGRGQEQLRGGVQPVGPRQEGARLQDPAGQGRTRSPARS